MCNPSKADEERNDHSVRRFIAFARGWGFAVLWVVNAHAFCATDPADMMAADDPIGPENDEWLRYGATHCEQAVVAWGVHGAHRGRDQEVMDLLAPWRPKLYHLGLTSGGHPRHPARLRRDTQRIPWGQEEGRP
jgi:hypothetical protein